MYQEQCALKIVLIIRADELSEMAMTTKAQHGELIAHGLYFAPLPFRFEVFLKDLPPFTSVPSLPAALQSFIKPFGDMPSRPDNLIYTMTRLSGELFFVAAVMMLLMAGQDAVPRWTLVSPLAQCAYNMKNDLVWVLLGNTFSPIGERNTIMTLDAVFIGGCACVYLNHFLS